MCRALAGHWQALAGHWITWVEYQGLAITGTGASETPTHLTPLVIVCGVRDGMAWYGVRNTTFNTPYSKAAKYSILINIKINYVLLQPFIECFDKENKYII